MHLITHVEFTQVAVEPAQNEATSRARREATQLQWRLPPAQALGSPFHIQKKTLTNISTQQTSKLINEPQASEALVGLG